MISRDIDRDRRDRISSQRMMRFLDRLHHMISSMTRYPEDGI